jgi:hypothetical protein
MKIAEKFEMKKKAEIFSGARLIFFSLPVPDFVAFWE